MNVKYFADTNVLVYAFDSSEPEKQKIAQQLLERHGNAGELTVSTQVLQEFFFISTRKLAEPLSAETAQQLVQAFSRYPIEQVTPRLIDKAIDRHRRESFSFWDSLVVEAALSSGSEVLLSEDMQDGRKINQLIIKNPFSEV